MTVLKKDDIRLLRDSRGSLYCYWGLAILMAALYSLLSWLTPYYLDDWSFMAVWRDDVFGGDRFSWKSWADYYNYIRGFDNGRISNALSPLSTLFSPWREIFPLLTGILLTLSAILIQKFSGGRRLSPSGLALVWLLMIIGLPWGDTIFVRDYSLNYIWAAAVTLIFLFTLKKGCHDNRWLWIAILMAVPAGGWHEGFATSTLCGLGLLMIIRRFRLPSSFYMVSAVYLASALLFMLSPGIINRFQVAISETGIKYFLKRPLVIIAVDFILAFILATLYRFRKGSLKGFTNLFNDTSVVVSLGILVSGYVLGYITVNTLRSYFWPDMAAICLAVVFIRRIFSLYPVRASYIRVGGILAALLCTAQSVAAIIWQNRYRIETEEIMALLDKSPSGTVFHDMKLPPDAPFYTLGMPVSNAWYNPYHYKELWTYYMTPVLGVVPVSMRDASPSETKSDTVGMTMPEYVDGEFLVPFITERGDTLIYSYDPL